MDLVEHKQTQDLTIKFFSQKEIHFENIMGHRIGEKWVAVMFQNNTKIYPAEGILEITITIKD